MSASPDKRDENGGFAPRLAWEWLQEEPEQMEWRWHTILPVGAVALFSAYMKTGKSTLGYDLALSTAKGIPFLGYPTTQTGVLVLVLEERPQHALHRLRDYGLTAEDPLWLLGRPVSPTPTFYRDLTAFVKTKHVGLVMVDSLSRFAEFQDENSNSEVTAFMAPLLDLAHGTGTTVLLVHHERKSAGDAGRGIRGAGAIFANADVALTLSRTEGGNTTARTLEVLGRFQEYAPAKLRLNFVDGRYGCLGPEEDQTREARKARVLGVITDAPRDVGEIAEAAQLPPRIVRPLLEALYQDGKLDRDGRGVKGSPFRYWVKPDSFSSREPIRGLVGKKQIEGEAVPHDSFPPDPTSRAEFCGTNPGASGVTPREARP